MAEFTPIAFGQVQDSPISHFSASSLNMLIRCPEQWRNRYVLKKIVPPDNGLLWGSADHRAVQWNFEQKQQTGQDVPVKEVQERFVYELDERFANEEVDPEADRSEIIERGLPLVSLYRETVAPYLLPEKIEEEFVLPSESFGLSMEVTGYIDYVMLDFDPVHGEPVAETRRIVERKTSKRSERKPKPDWIVQGRVYQLVRDLPLEFQVSVKTKTPKVQVDPETLLFQPPRPQQTVMFLRQQLEYLAHLMRTYGPDHPWPVTGLAHTWACDWCGYRKECPAWRA